jgi:hypothetical protein
LTPYQSCAGSAADGYTALAALTFVLVVVVYPALSWWLLWNGARDDSAVATRACGFLVSPFRQNGWRTVWAVPVRFGRKLLFAALIGGAKREDLDTTVPLLLFLSLTALLVAQVRARASASLRVCRLL